MNHPLDKEIKNRVFELCSELRFIEKIKEGDIIDVAHRMFMPRSYPTSIYRTFFTLTESRNATFKYFSTVYHESIDIIDRHRVPGGVVHVVMRELIGCIVKSIDGLRNNIKTYQLDNHYTSRIETLINYIETWRSHSIQYDPVNELVYTNHSPSYPPREH